MPLASNTLPCASLWFYRDYDHFTGGHLKVSHYLASANASRFWQPKLVFSENSHVSDGLWAESIHCRVASWNTQPGDVVFVAGMDWLYFDQANVPSELPVINLIQGVRHANPNTALYSYLSRRAIRICVSEQVKAAILDTGQCNGPVYVIENGIDHASVLPSKPLPSAGSWLLVGIKNPVLASQVAEALKVIGVDVELVNHSLTQMEFLQKLDKASVAVCFPLKEEGFYLPALESMARNTLVICPDCVGNRDFCKPGTALMPEPSVNSYLACAKHILAMREGEVSRLLDQAQKTSLRYTREAESTHFLSILEEAYELW